MIKRFAKLPKIIKDSKELSSDIDEFAQLEKSIQLLSSCFGNFTSAFRSIIAKKIDNQSSNQTNQIVDDSLSNHHHKDKTVEEQQQVLSGSVIKNIEQRKMKQYNFAQEKHQQLQQEIEPRFKEVNVPIPTIKDFNISDQLDQYLTDWLGMVCKIVFSAGFNLFEKGILSESKTKSFCSQNFIRNILRFCERYELQPKHFSLINKTLQKQILPYFLLKYPQSQQKQSSKKFSSVLIEKDDTTQNDIDLVFKSGVPFKINQSGNYNSDIMTFFNWIMKLPNLQVDRGESLYESFLKDVGSLFKMVENETQMMDMLKFDPKNPKTIKQVGLQLMTNYFETGRNIKQNNENTVKKNHQQEKAEFEYRQKVKSYTHYLIGSKLSTNLDIFSVFDIKSANLRFKNSALMRVATKFCEQLQKCYDFKQILNRESLFRMKDGSQKFLNNQDKMMLNLFLRFQKKLIDQKLESIMKNNSEHQSFFARNCNQSSLSKFSEGQAIVGKFSSIIYKLGESYLIYYLNLLLHGINKAANNYGSVKDYKNSTEFKEKINDYQLRDLFQDYGEKQIGQQWLNTVYKQINIKQRSPENAVQETPELINFKIGDLMRCKCVSKENEILAIYKQVERISHIKPSLFKIIRVKNRLNQGNKDILMNLIYKQKTVVEMQLTIKSQKSNFIECSNKFNHYLYELKRAKFGPLTQMCCIWVNQDLRSPFYVEKIKQIMEQKKVSEKQKKPCCLLPENQQIRNLPFRCSQCQSFYYTCSTSQKHTSCMECKKITCFWCKIKHQEEKQEFVQDIVESNPGIDLQSAEFSQKVPSNGGILVNLKSNSKDLSFFNTSLHDGYYYLFQALKNKPKQNEIPRLNLLYKFKNKNNKFQSDFLKDNLIMSSNKITQKIFQISKHQTNLFVFIPQYLTKRYEIRSKSVFLNQKKIHEKYFTELKKSYPQLSQKVWNSVERLNLASNMLKNIEEVIPEMFPDIEYLILNRNYLEKIGCEKTVFHWKNLKYLNISNNSILQINGIVSDFPNLVVCDISYNVINQLPANLSNLTSLVRFNVTSNNLTVLGAEFSGLVNLEVLIARLNRVEKIEVDFCKMKKLRSLELEQNLLTKIPHQFSEFKLLEKLQLNSNQIADFPDIFDNLQELQNLQLERLMMKKIPSTITQLPKLKIFKINASSLEQMPQDIGQLNSLKQLQANHCKFSQSPSSFSKLINLTKLNLIAARVSTLPEDFGCLTSLSTIDLKQSEIIALPQSIQFLKNLTKINLQQCMKINQLPQSFGRLNSLSELNLRSSNIMKLPSSFGNLKRLSKLNLSYSKIQALPENFGNLASLTELNIIGTMLITLPLSFGNLKSLLTLNLLKSKIQNLPQSFGKIRTLTQLSLGSTPLQSLPSNFGGLRNLSTLKLSLSKIQSMPESFGNLTTLTHLDLLQTKIKSLPKSFGGLKSLVKLDLSRGQIQSLPQSFGDLQALVELDLSNTRLTHLPQSFGSLKSLKIARLKQSSIQQLPESFGSLKSIQQLILNYAPIQKLPFSFGNLRTLKRLYLQETLINQLPQSFGNLTSLSQLYLAQTPIASLPLNFGGLQSLKKLDLNESKMSSLPQSFSELKCLQKLLLKKTPMEIVPLSFGLLQSLQILDFQGSEIRKFPESFGNLKKLNGLNLKRSKIQSLPQSLGNILSLSEIDISETKGLTTLPESFGRLKNIEKFYVNGSNINHLPNSFGELSEGIRELNFSNTALVQLPLSFGLLKHLRDLVLTGSPIKILPESFGQLTSLSILQLNRTKIQRLPDSFGRLSSLYVFNLLDSEQLVALPQSFGQLIKLKDIKISGKSLTKLPDSFGQLQNLQSLQILRTSIAELPESIGDLARIKNMQIMQSPISHLPPSFCNLKQLTKLNLSKTAIQFLPENFGKLSGLTNLKISQTKLKSLPDSFSELNQLSQIQLLSNYNFNQNCLLILAKMPGIYQIKLFIGDAKLEDLSLDELSQEMKRDKWFKIHLQCTSQVQFEKIRSKCQQKELKINVQFVNIAK